MSSATNTTATRVEAATQDQSALEGELEEVRSERAASTVSGGLWAQGFEGYEGAAVIAGDPLEPAPLSELMRAVARQLGELRGENVRLTTDLESRKKALNDLATEADDLREVGRRFHARIRQLEAELESTLEDVDAWRTQYENEAEKYHRASERRRLASERRRKAARKAKK